MAATAPAYANLEYRDRVLRWPGGSATAAAGRAGVRRDKREGDGATPAGTFSLVFGLYRPDRVEPPRSALPMRPMRPEQGWVDAPGDPNYNRLVSLPYPASAEHMWRDDPVYDVVVVISYNMDPIVPGAGSAIFLHVARPDFSGTDGCVAVRKDVLLRLLPRLGPGSTITMHASPA
ncbi:MAG: L,D-transpeptidase family protein [Alphaproteobacteria bacterium]|nr:L,D-transpeptidase family protein [Alphaproteobacteria bacterium]